MTMDVVADRIAMARRCRRRQCTLYVSHIQRGMDVIPIYWLHFPPTADRARREASSLLSHSVRRRQIPTRDTYFINATARSCQAETLNCLPGGSVSLSWESVVVTLHIAEIQVPSKLNLQSCATSRIRNMDL